MPRKLNAANIRSTKIRITKLLNKVKKEYKDGDYVFNNAVESQQLPQ